jgi:hypothetical protein
MLSRRLAQTLLPFLARLHAPIVRDVRQGLAIRCREQALWGSIRVLRWVEGLVDVWSTDISRDGRVRVGPPVRAERGHVELASESGGWSGPLADGRARGGCCGMAASKSSRRLGACRGRSVLHGGKRVGCAAQWCRMLVIHAVGRSSPQVSERTGRGGGNAVTVEERFPHPLVRMLWRGHPKAYRWRVRQVSLRVGKAHVAPGRSVLSVASLGLNSEDHDALRYAGLCYNSEAAHAAANLLAWHGELEVPKHDQEGVVTPGLETSAANSVDTLPRGEITSVKAWLMASTVTCVPDARGATVTDLCVVFLVL